MRKVLLTVLFVCLASGAFAGNIHYISGHIRYIYGLPSHYGTDHYSIWFGRLPPGVVPVRLCVRQYVTPEGYVIGKVCGHRPHHIGYKHIHVVKARF